MDLAVSVFSADNLGVKHAQWDNKYSTSSTIYPFISGSKPFEALNLYYYALVLKGKK